MIIILSVDCTVWNFRGSTEDLLDVCFMSFWSIRLFTLRQSVTYGCCCSFVECEGTLHQYLKSNWCHKKPVYFVFLTVSACGKSQITKETDFQKGFLKFQAMLRLFVAFMVCGQNTPQRAKPSSSDRSQINWRLITFITMITSSVCVCVCVCVEEEEDCGESLQRVVMWFMGWGGRRNAVRVEWVAAAGTPRGLVQRMTSEISTVSTICGWRSQRSNTLSQLSKLRKFPKKSAQLYFIWLETLWSRHLSLRKIFIRQTLICKCPIWCCFVAVRLNINGKY